MPWFIKGRRLVAKAPQKDCANWAQTSQSAVITKLASGSPLPVLTLVLEEWRVVRVRACVCVCVCEGGIVSHSETFVFEQTFQREEDSLLMYLLLIPTFDRVRLKPFIREAEGIRVQMTALGTHTAARLGW